MSVNNISVEPVKTRRQLRRFARFNVHLYKGNPYSVPDLIGDTINSFTPSRNAAFEFCEAQPFLALKDGKVVGRVAAIINHKANDVWGVKTVRFGWIDFIDDIRVTEAMLDAVAAWGRERGMKRLEGPFGFTDFDPEGMLTEGFDRMGTMATIYNYPYYPQHMEKLGLTASAKWVERNIPYNDVPEKMERLGKIVMDRYDLHLARLEHSITEEARVYAYKLFELVNECYAPLYGYSAFSKRQIDDFVKRYLPLLDKRLAVLVLDKDEELVAAALTMPSIAEALHKAQGRLFPFGWWHILKALKVKHSNVLEMLFVAVKPEYQNKGVSAIPFGVLTGTATGLGYNLGETNPELETNNKVQSQWSYFKGVEIVRRRAVFYKTI
ncbi:MAG: N-acetyltransferase [Bacteroidaceae bacterium]|nr:N-acetyltransferase [Bacteroidaceae bacterium]MBR4810346.1 N-acetyltransferase [Bacteroidaceae bacterium]